MKCEIAKEPQHGVRRGLCPKATSSPTLGSRYVKMRTRAQSHQQQAGRVQEPPMPPPEVLS